MQNHLELAFEHHRQGRLLEAAQLYRTVLSEHPGHADALHLLGLVAHQQGDHGRAIELIAQAVAAKPDNAVYHANLAEAYRAVGQLDQVIACCHTALRLKPEFAEAANTLGLARMAGNQTQAAVEQFRTALRLRPGFALACTNLGNALRLLGDSAGALAHFRQAVDLDPNLAEGQSNLGQFLLEQKRPHEALVHCREAVRLRPHFPEAHSNLGNVLRELARLDEAKQCYAEALRLNSNVAMLYNNMAQALQEEGRLDDARAWYTRGLELDPNLARLHYNLGSLFAEQENQTEAVRCYETALGLDPNSAEAHAGLGGIWHEQGRYEDAQKCYQLALLHKPDHAPALCSLGQVREEFGDFSEAEQYLREALRHDSRLIGAWSQLATLLRGKLPDNGLQSVRQLLADPDLTPGKRAALRFGLAQVLDARKEFDEAGEHLVHANAISLAERRKRGLGYDPAAHTQFVNSLVATFDQAFSDRVRDFGVDSERPIFIVGLPRSGTTLVEQILASHSNVFGAGELPVARETFLRLANDGSDEHRALENVARLDRPAARVLADWHLAKLGSLNADAPRLADKMPDNYLYLGFLAALFPRAKFIHCRRDLRDIGVSCWMTNFQSIRWANAFEHIAARFQDYERITDHWRQVLPVPVLEVQYEETVDDLEGVARQLVSWCGLDWDPRCLNFHEGRRPVRTASVMQVRQPIYRRSVARWRQYEKTLADLFAMLPSPAARDGGSRPPATHECAAGSSAKSVESPRVIAAGGAPRR
jgi:tetratricopeptide (TPR) repeat protein